MRNLKILFLFLTAFSVVGFVFAKPPVSNNNGKNKGVKNVSAGCAPGNATAFIDLNNVKAIIGTNGGKWQDGNASYEIPKGSGKHSVFAGGIWVAGVDVNGQLRVSARTFTSQGEDDYWPGPLVSKGDNMGNVTPEVCNQYDRLWKVDREMVSRFISWYDADEETRARDFTGYTVPTVLAEWPGNGPDFTAEDNEYDRFLAPFADVNNDGRYSAEDGDYPNYEFDAGDRDCKFIPERRADSLNNSSVTLYGDQTIWWVYNDKGNIHTETQGAAIGMEVRAQGFAFSTNDELNNMTFYNYQLINRSSYTLNNAFFGVWSDIDLGDADDDLLGCDVNRGLMFGYNFTNKDGDGSGNTYGENPPAVGFDFFEGPYKDESGLDELSNWPGKGEVIPDCQWGYRDVLDEDGEPIDRIRVGEGDIFNGNINGLNFGDGIIDNQRWGMRRFIIYEIGSDPVIGDVEVAIDYYNYLRGIWKDGSRMTYGGNGTTGTIATDFLFPWDSDECNWGTSGVDPGDNTPGGWRMSSEADGRVLTSAGSFILRPGATNYITYGVPWARDFINGHMGSVELLKLADDKCQKLFENCFRMIEGPNAPDLTVVELDRKLLIQISNPASSNNYNEQYSEEDPFITKNYTDRRYKFQGYQVFQLKNRDVTVNQLYDTQFSKLVYQCDIEDNVTRLINFEWDANAQANSYAIMVEGENKGIRHSFHLTYDMFGSSGDTRLVNYKKYYYIAIAYAYNRYKRYDQNDGNLLDGQKLPYLASRKGATGEIKKYEFTPQPTYLGSGGIQTNSEYGDIPPMSVHSGRGNSVNFIDLTDECHDDILRNNSVSVRKYKKNAGPVQVTVIDPLNVVDGDFVLFIEPDSVNIKGASGYDFTLGGPTGFSNTDNNGLILNSKWTLVRNGVDTLAGDVWMRNSNEYLIPEYGIAINMLQSQYPIEKVGSLQSVASFNNGLIGSSKTYSNPTIPWFDGFNDADGQIPLNWIRAGSYRASGYNDVIGADDDQNYEQVLNGTWAPYKLVSVNRYGPGNDMVTPSTINHQKYRLPSIDFVITKDTSKWTRCIVIETCENTRVNGVTIYPNPIAEGGARKFMLRQAPSKNKMGISADTVGQISSTNPNDPNYISAYGMSWFPGYAIDVETGERLNIAFGEDSYLIGQNGRDMIWNPTTSYFSIDGTPQFGGKHYVYVFSTGHGHSSVAPFPKYDSGQLLFDAFKQRTTDANLTTTLTRIGNAMLNAAWVTIPRIPVEYQWKEYADMPESDVNIKIRIANPYMRNMGSLYGNPIEDQINKGYPYFKFSLDGLSAVRNSKQVLVDNLDRINVVPNPYYAYNPYEKTQLDNIVKFTNLPKECVVKIFNISGTLIREFVKSNDQTWIDWNLTNSSDVPIAGGVYIIHVSVPNVGEKVLKWFGVLRPADLSNF